MPLRDADDHPQRLALASELHARPFPALAAPCRAAYVAFKQPTNAADRDPAGDRAHLAALLKRYSAPPAAQDANHHTADLGRARLKWERHTEFVSYTLFAEGVSERPFSGEIFDIFPAEWIEKAPGTVIAAALVRVETRHGDDPEPQVRALGTNFAPESLTVSTVGDDAATVMADFRIDEAGFSRFAVIARDGLGERRLGRIVQRLLEIETYKSMAMLTLPEARRVAGRVAALDRDLSSIVQELSAGTGTDTGTLDRLLVMAAEIELLASTSAFRFGAAGAYESIVNQRIEVLREARIAGRQTLAEFMMRRFDPAMRTCRSAEMRLRELSERAGKASNLLRTRVEVGLAESNQQVLTSMNRRAALQLRLQQTVEGLSVVAISYYAVGLLVYMLKPLAEAAGLSEGWLIAGTVPAVLAAVTTVTARIRRRLERD